MKDDIIEAMTIAFPMVLIMILSFIAGQSLERKSWISDAEARSDSAYVRVASFDTSIASLRLQLHACVASARQLSCLLGDERGC